MIFSVAATQDKVNKCLPELLPTDGVQQEIHSIICYSKDVQFFHYVSEATELGVIMENDIIEKMHRVRYRIWGS